MAKYTRRHYEDVASLLSESFATLERADAISDDMGANEILEVVMMQFVAMFKTDNDRFSADRFISATIKDRK